MLIMKCREVPPEKVRFTLVPGVAKLISPVNLREISALCGVVLAVTGAGGRQQITHEK